MTIESRRLVVRGNRGGLRRSVSIQGNLAPCPDANQTKRRTLHAFYGTGFIHSIPYVLDIGTYKIREVLAYSLSRALNNALYRVSMSWWAAHAHATASV